MKQVLDRNTAFCMSIAKRPGDFGIRFHNFLYEELGLNFLYKNFGVATVEGFQQSIQAMRALGIRGCGVSMPYKENAFACADQLSPEARKIGAINTLVNDGKCLTGYNTDFLAVKELLSKVGEAEKVSHLRQHSSDPQSAPKTSAATHSLSVLLLGSGGMARAIACALSELGFQNTTLLSRNAETGKKLAQDFGFRWKKLQSDSDSDSLSGSSSPSQMAPAQSVPLQIETADVLINATPLGMSGEQDPLPFNRNQMEKAHWVMDSVGPPQDTPLIRLSRSLNKKVIAGFEISILQAVEQFYLYTGVRPQSEQVRRAAQFAASQQ